ncbi:MAG: PAS domain S-box protein, partial [Proteobacteria bacterium]|nr:PAS domain S-box protein [Pseudomonadota bacterium]
MSRRKAAPPLDPTLQRDAERFRLLAENVHDLIAEYDGSGRLLYSNSRLLEGLGYTVEQFRTLRPLAYVHPDDHKDFARSLTRTLDTAESSTTRFRARRQDGNWSWLEANACTYHTPEGDQHLVVIARDITERKRAEERLRESMERYQALVEDSPEGIFVVARGEVLYANRTFARIVGHESPEAVIGQRILDFADPSSRERLKQNMERANRGEALAPDEYRVLRPDGEVRDVIGSASVVTYEGERASQAVVRDVTDPKQSERQQERLRMELQEARKLESLGVLAGGIAHDFNNLLAVVLGNSRYVHRQLESEPELARALEDAVDAAESAARLTRQLLAYAGRREPDVRPVDLSEQVNQLSALLESALKKKVFLRFDLAEDLPRVQADVVQLEQ